MEDSIMTDVTDMPKKSTSIGLIMIVGNEEKIIKRCLESVVGFVDFISICVNGNDDSPKIIQEFMDKTNIPGKVITTRWVNFGKNRTESFKQGRKTARILGFPLERTWLFTLDADHVLTNHSGLDKTKLSGTHYSMNIKWGYTTYKVTKLMRADCKWRCVGRTHEVWKCMDRGGEVSHSGELLSGPWISDKNDGGSKEGKYERDLKFLEMDRSGDPENSRPHFYLGQTHRYMKKYFKAIRSYKKCISCATWDEEIWYSTYMIGFCYQFSEKWEKAMKWYLKAYDLRPSRAEPVYKIARYYREKHMYNVAMIYVKEGMSIKPEGIGRDTLFIETDVYAYQFHIELSIIAHYIRKPELGLLACERCKFLPEGVIDQVSRLVYAGTNIQYYVKPAREQKYINLGELIMKSPYGKKENLEEFHGYCPMNPCIHNLDNRGGKDEDDRGNDFLIILRMVNFHIVNGAYVHHDEDKVVRTRNLLIHVTTPVLEVRNICELVVPNRLRPTVHNNNKVSLIQGLEDCRIAEVKRSGNNVEMTFSCSSWDYGNGTGPQICLCSVDIKKFLKVDDLEYEIPKINIKSIVPLITAPSETGFKTNTVEKNWLPFIRSSGENDEDSNNGVVHFIYDSGPRTTILAYNKKYNLLKVVSADKPTQYLCEFRGSAGPIWISESNLWLYLIHEVIPVRGPRKYIHRFVVMNNKFHVTGYSKPFFFLSLGVEFACGMCLSGTNLWITFGSEDHEAYLYKVPLDKVMKEIHMTTH